MILNISYYDVYSGIEIEGESINVRDGLYPFIDGQKFLNKGTKLIVEKFVFDYSKSFKNHFITHVVFKDIKSGTTKTIKILDVLKSIHEGRTKFSL